MASRPYLDFYEKHKIIPVRQDIGDLARHFARRQALYAQLGLLSGLFRNRRVLEIGPGTGDNALYTATLDPSLLVLLDANSASLAALREKVASGRLPAASEIVEADAMKWSDERRFDVVLCEGLLPAQNDQAGFLERIASFVDEDGVLVVTTVSFTSLFAETCRRAMRPVFEESADGLPDLVARLVAFFGPDLRSLPGMSRLHEDWVLDQIVHPYSKSAAFTLQDVIAVLDDGYDFVGSSPRFLTDWRWYKSVPESPLTWNQRAVRQIDRLSASFIDYRADPAETDEALGRAIEERCRRLWELHVDLLDGERPADYPVFLAEVDEIRNLLPSAFAPARRSIEDYFRGMEQLLAKNAAPDFGSFRTLFGRGQQYAAMTRRRTATGVP